MAHCSSKTNLQVSNGENKECDPCSCVCDPEEIDSIVFQGGGSKGLAYYGVISALSEASSLSSASFSWSNIKNVCGTSAGAIAALAVSLGYEEDLAALKQLIVDQNLVNYLDDSNSSTCSTTALQLYQKFTAGDSNASKIISSNLGNASRLYSDLSKNLGLFATTKVRVMLEDLIITKTGIPNCTFAELQKHTTGFKNLYIVGYNLSRKQSVTFCAARTPNAVISDCVIISMCIPIIFHPHTYQIKQSIPGKEPTVTKDETNNASGKGYGNDLWIDGGLVDNFPIHVLDFHDAMPGESRDLNMKTLGFSFYDQPGNNETLIEEEETETGGRLGKYIGALVDTLLNQQQCHAHGLGQDSRRTIYIPTHGIDSFKFNLTFDDKKLLINSGWDSTKAWLGSKSVTIGDKSPTSGWRTAMFDNDIIINPTQHYCVTLLAKETTSGFLRWKKVVGTLLIEGFKEIEGKIEYFYKYMEFNKVDDGSSSQKSADQIYAEYKDVFYFTWSISPSTAPVLTEDKSDSTNNDSMAACIQILAKTKVLPDSFNWICEPKCNQIKLHKVIEKVHKEYLQNKIQKNLQETNN